MAWPCVCKYGVSLNVELRYKDADYVCSLLTPRVAALALQALEALHTHTLASFPGFLLPVVCNILINLSMCDQHVCTYNVQAYAHLWFRTSRQCSQQLMHAPKTCKVYVITAAVTSVITLILIRAYYTLVRSQIHFVNVLTGALEAHKLLVLTRNHLIEHDSIDPNVHCVSGNYCCKCWIYWSTLWDE